MDQETYNKIEWIEINLPWNVSINYNGPNHPCLDDREKEVFGISLSELEKINQSHLDNWYILWEKLESIKYEANKNKQCNDYTKLEADFWAEHSQDECIVKRNQFFELRKKICTWSDEQPEFKVWQSASEEFISEQKKKSFTGLGLNVPGTLVEVEDGSIEFIGTMNELAGVCNDCVAFDKKLIIKRYALVFPFSKKKANDEFYENK